MTRNIFLLIPKLYPGGAEAVCLNYANMLFEKYNTTIVVYNQKQVNADADVIGKLNSNVKIIYFFTLLDFLRLFTFINSNSDAVWIGFMERSNLLLRFAGLFKRTKSIYTVHATVEALDRRPFLNKLLGFLLYRYFLPRNSCVLTVTNINSLSLSQKFHLTNVSFIYNSLALESFKLVQPVETSKFKFLFVGRLEDVKNPKLAIDFVHRLISSGFTCDLTIIGNGSLYSELIDYVEILGVKKYIFINGASPNFFLYNKEHYNCLLSTSKFESFGINIIEAITVGIPVLALNCPTGPGEIATKLEYKFIRLVDYFVDDSSEQIISRMENVFMNCFMPMDVIYSELDCAKSLIIKNFSNEATSAALLGIVENVQ